MGRLTASIPVPRRAGKRTRQTDETDEQETGRETYTEREGEAHPCERAARLPREHHPFKHIAALSALSGALRWGRSTTVPQGRARPRHRDRASTNGAVLLSFSSALGGALQSSCAALLLPQGVHLCLFATFLSGPRSQYG